MNKISNYIKILDSIKLPKTFDYKRFYDDLVLLHKESSELKEYMVSNNLYFIKYNSRDITSLFHNVYRKKIKFKDNNSLVAYSKVGNDFFILTNNRNDIKILSDIPSGKLTYDDGKTHTGKILLFTKIIPQAYLKCKTFDYEKTLVDEKDKIIFEYNSKLVGMILYNYLLIYWNYNKSKMMLKNMVNIIEKKININKNDIEDVMMINFLQAKKILAYSYTDGEINYLDNYIQNQCDLKSILCGNVLLERKIESKKLYNILNKEDKFEFDNWPIRNLFYN